MDKFQSALTIFSALCTLLFVLALAYITIKWMGSRMSVQTNSRLIKVLDRVMIGQDKCLLVVKVAEETMLIGMSGDAVEKLCDLTGNLNLETAVAQAPPEFSEVLRDSLHKGWKGIRRKGEREPHEQ
ncbi:MAG: flagellar biosynthetic protein FliO [Angelakisella sp.]